MTRVCIGGSRMYVVYRGLAITQWPYPPRACLCHEADVEVIATNNFGFLVGDGF